MIAIDDDQLCAFADRESAAFVDRMVVYIRDNFPMKYVKAGEAKVESHARAIFDEAKRYGFETERQIVSYLDLGLRFGRLSDAAWAKAFLETGSQEPERRMRGMQHAALRHHRLARP